MLNIANKLTLARVIMIPLFIAFALVGGFWWDIAALATFIIASLTDLLDGKIARKYNMVTDFGKFMDPLADKLLVTAALCVLVHKAEISVWFLFIITLREFVVTGLRLVAAGGGTVIAASVWGKVKTTLQLIVISIALAPIGFVHAPILLSKSFVYWGMWAVAIVTVVSGLDYVVKNKKVFADVK